MARRQRSKGAGSLFKRGGRGPWVASWYDHTGTRREKSTRTTDKRAAEQILAKIVAESALRVHGVIDPAQDRYRDQRGRPIGDHLEEFKTDLAGKGNTGKHATQTHRYAQRVLALASVDCIADLAPATIQAAIAEIRDGASDVEGGGKPASLRTCNAYLRAVKQFSSWLRRDKRTPEDALECLRGFNESTDRKYERRAFDDDELGTLLQVTKTSGEAMGLTGEDRAMAYLLAASTGFRAAELRSLTRESFDLSQKPPTITVLAGYSKRRRQDVQPIQLELADELREWMKTKPAGCSVLNLPEKTAKMLHADMVSARAKWVADAESDEERKERSESDFLKPIDLAGHVLDFHSLRSTYVSRVVTSGASVKVCQELARHSTPSLTIGRYAHVHLNDLTRALDNLGMPKTSCTPDEKKALRATGTCDTTPSRGQNRPPLYPPQLAHEPLRTGAKVCEGRAPSSSRLRGRKVLSDRNIRGPVRPRATDFRNAPPGTRTPDPLIKSQLLCQLS